MTEEWVARCVPNPVTTLAAQQNRRSVRSRPKEPRRHMDWQAIQAVAELVAAVGVILSLVYLSRQVRQNTHSIRTAANHGW